MVYTVLGVDGYLSQYGIRTFFVGIGEWFLGAILIAYAVFPVFCVGLKKNRWLMFAIMTVLFGLCVFFYDDVAVLSKLPTYTNAFMKLYEFFLGMFLVSETQGTAQGSLLKRGLSGNVIHAKWRFVYTLLAAPVLLFYVYYPTWLPYNSRIIALRILIQNVAAFLFLVGLEGLFQRASVLKRPLAFISKYTYFIFLVHHVIMNLMPDHVPFQVSSNGSVLGMFAMEIVVILLAAVIVSLISGFVDRWMNFFLTKTIWKKRG